MIKFIKLSSYLVTIAVLSTLGFFCTQTVLAADRSQEMLNYIDQTISGNSGQKAKMKSIYLDLINRYPEIKQKKTIKISDSS